jgi:hypothetical protein
LLFIATNLPPKIIYDIEHILKVLNMKIICFALSWCFWAVGHISSMILNVFGNSERWANIWYPLYNKAMLLSCDCQDAVAGDGQYWPWGK